MSADSGQSTRTKFVQKVEILRGKLLLTVLSALKVGVGLFFRFPEKRQKTLENAKIVENSIC